MRCCLRARRMGRSRSHQDRLRDPATRHFYRYVPPRPLAEIDGDIRELGVQIQAASRGGRRVKETRPLRAYAEVSLGRQRSPEHAEGPFMVPYLRAANVKDGELDLNDVLNMNFSPKEQTVFALRSGDVLVTEGSGSLSSVGASAVCEHDRPVWSAPEHPLRLRPRGNTDPRFLAWWCHHAFASGQFASVATGANISHLSAERGRSLPMTWMPLPAANGRRRLPRPRDRANRCLLRERQMWIVEAFLMQRRISSPSTRIQRRTSLIASRRNQRLDGPRLMASVSLEARLKSKVPALDAGVRRDPPRATLSIRQDRRVEGYTWLITTIRLRCPRRHILITGRLIAAPRRA